MSRAKRGEWHKPPAGRTKSSTAPSGRASVSGGAVGVKFVKFVNALVRRGLDRQKRAEQISGVVEFHRNGAFDFQQRIFRNGAPQILA